MTFAADIPTEERERLTAEVMDQISEKPAEPTVEERISASADEEFISRATSIDIAKALQLLICEDFKGYTITIENTGDNYIVDVQGDADGATISWKK